MRALSERQARRCEEAKGGRCRCRCGGAFHGADRARLEAEALGLDETSREWFEELPPDDPHKLTTLTPAARAKREKSAAATKARKRQLPLPLEEAAS